MPQLAIVSKVLRELHNELRAQPQLFIKADVVPLQGCSIILSLQQPNPI